MRISRRSVAITAAVGALAAGGVAVANAVSGDPEEAVTGPAADRAAKAALEAVGGGTVQEVEYQDGDGAGLYEVEVQRPDGSSVEVHLRGDLSSAGTAADDDGSGEDEGAEDEGAEDEGAEDEGAEDEGAEGAEDAED